VYPIAGLDILCFGGEKISCLCQDWNLGSSSPLASHYTNCATEALILNCAQFVIINNIYAIVNSVPSKQSTRTIGNDAIMIK
jgi:hypothetical protein